MSTELIKTRTWKGEFSDTEKKFLVLYATCDDPVLAARQAGYSEASVAWVGKRLLAKMEARMELSDIKTELGMPTEVTAEDIVREFKIIAEANMLDYVDEFGEIKPMEEMDPMKAKAIKSIERTVNPKTGHVTTKLTLHDKISALQNLGKNIGWYAADNGQSQGDVNIQINLPGGLGGI